MKSRITFKMRCLEVLNFRIFQVPFFFVCFFSKVKNEVFNNFLKGRKIVLYRFYKTIACLHKSGAASTHMTLVRQALSLIYVTVNSQEYFQMQNI